MAIIDGTPGLVVEIIVGGTPVREYDDDEADDSKYPMLVGSVTKYIEAQTDTEFKFRCKFSPQFPYRESDYKFRFIVDGVRLASAIIYNKEVAQSRMFEMEGNRYSKNGQWFMRDFRFAKLKLGRCNYRRQ
jgi:hypothetical protein